MFSCSLRASCKQAHLGETRPGRGPLPQKTRDIHSTVPQHDSKMPQILGRADNRPHTRHDIIALKPLNTARFQRSTEPMQRTNYRLYHADPSSHTVHTASGPGKTPTRLTPRIRSEDLLASDSASANLLWPENYRVHRIKAAEPL